MSNDPRATLLALVELASSSVPGSCWDDGRAAELLRANATAAELRDLGVAEAMIQHIFGEAHAR